MTWNWTKTPTAILGNGTTHCPQCGLLWKGNHTWFLGGLPLCNTLPVARPLGDREWDESYGEY